MRLNVRRDAMPWYSEGFLDRLVDNLWYSIPMMILIMVTVWYRDRAIKKGWVTQEWCDDIVSRFRAILVVVAVLAFCVYYLLIPHPPW